MKGLYNENYKTLMKKIEKGTNILCPCVSEQAWGAGGVNDILLLNGPTLVLQGSPCRARLALPTTTARERRLSKPEIGEKERD